MYLLFSCNLPHLRVLAVLLANVLLLQPNWLTAEQVPVRHKEGLLHGFLALRTLEGKKLVDGEITQVTEGGRLTDDLIFRFKDGSIYEDKSVFTQKGSFRLLSDHLVEKGPSFKQPMETLIDASTLLPGNPAADALPSPARPAALNNSGGAAVAAAGAADADAGRLLAWRPTRNG